MIWVVLDKPYVSLLRPSKYDDEARLPPRGLLRFRHCIWGNQVAESGPVDPEVRSLNDKLALTRLLLARNASFGKPERVRVERNGVFEFHSDWDLLTIDETSLETSRIVGAVLQFDPLLYDLQREKEKRSAEEAANTHLWALRGREDHCGLIPLDVDGTELARGRGLFVYAKGRVWACETPLSERNWRILVDEKMGIHQGDTTGGVPAGPERFIATEVRREVWRRDQGRCATCGSQERLEFDHIIPVSMGGSSTVRNIQLLCERCNREKGPTLG